MVVSSIIFLKKISSGEEILSNISKPGLHTIHVRDSIISEATHMVIVDEKKYIFLYSLINNFLYRIVHKSSSVTHCIINLNDDMIYYAVPLTYSISKPIIDYLLMDYLNGIKR